MKLAVRAARIGYGNTYPNPAVGCVLVRQSKDGDGGENEEEGVVAGTGFHPRAGMPHAEVFALYEACGHVVDGVEAARAVMGVDDESGDDAGGSAGDGALVEKVGGLVAAYSEEGGASTLFGGAFNGDSTSTMTAYVTLEPCCHYGQTPPCAASLAAAGVDRVVVGRLDPNPKVDGGGIAVLRRAGVQVDVMRAKKARTRTAAEYDRAAYAAPPSRGETEAAKECKDLVDCFVKRISGPSGVDSTAELDEAINGARRVALRKLANQRKAAGTMTVLEWPQRLMRRNQQKQPDSNDDDDDAVSSDEGESIAETIPLHHVYLERLDAALWADELVLLRLKGAVSKKKDAKILGRRAAEEMGAHVAQVVGHTVLLYRPGMPRGLDLEEMILETADVTAS